MKKAIALFFLTCLCALPTYLWAQTLQVTGKVVSKTSGSPLSGASVRIKGSDQGTVTDAQGKFSINQAPSGQGPSMLRVEQDGVTYNHIMPPGSPTADIGISIYDASKKPGAAAVSKHMLLFEPNGGQLTVNETFLYKNDGKTTWSDPQNGTLRFFLPKEANGTVDVKGSAPDGMPVPVPTEKSSQPDIYVAKFEIKPGETRLRTHPQITVPGLKDLVDGIFGKPFVRSPYAVHVLGNGLGRIKGDRRLKRDGDPKQSKHQSR